MNEGRFARAPYRTTAFRIFSIRSGGEVLGIEVDGVGKTAGRTIEAIYDNVRKDRLDQPVSHLHVFADTSARHG